MFAEECVSVGGGRSVYVCAYFDPKRVCFLATVWPLRVSVHYMWTWIYRASLSAN